MWSKAADLASSTNRITPAPGCSKLACMVASTSPPKPHFVTHTSDGHFECDENCPAFIQRYICSHCVAAAENNGLLQDCKSVTPNFTQLSMVNLPRRTAGRKGGKAPKKKLVARRKTVPNEQRRPLIGAGPTDNSTAPSFPYDSTEPVSTSPPAITVITTSSGNWNWK